MSPIKRSSIVVISVFGKAFLVAFYKCRNKFSSSRILRYSLKFSKFVSTLVAFFFGHKGIFGMNPIPFRMMPLKELLFFKAFISLLQFHNAHTIGQNI